MVEEDVHQLPQHVVGGLGQLLADVRVGAGRDELPLGAGLAEGQSEAATAAGDLDGTGGLAAVLAGAEHDQHVVGSCQNADPGMEPRR